MVIRNALFFGSGKWSSQLLPWATYTEPEIAHVGAYGYELEVWVKFCLGHCVLRKAMAYISVSARAIQKKMCPPNNTRASRELKR